MKKRILLWCLIGLFALLWGYTTLHAANLVNNPGFETWSGGVPVGWSVNRTSAASFCNVLGHNNVGYSPALGAWSYTSLDTVSQTIDTIPGAVYTFSFWANVMIDPNQNQEDEQYGGYSPILRGYWNNELVVDLYVTGDWLFCSSSVVATGTSTTISFAGRNAHSVSAVDDVFVDRAPSAVPGPGTILLFAPGLIGLAGLRRRTKKPNRLRRK
jgi:hypothetical protein